MPGTVLSSLHSYFFNFVDSLRKLVLPSRTGTLERLSILFKDTLGRRTDRSSSQDGLIKKCAEVGRHSTIPGGLKAEVRAGRGGKAGAERQGGSSPVPWEAGFSQTFPLVPHHPLLGLSFSSTFPLPLGLPPGLGLTLPRGTSQDPSVGVGEGCLRVRTWGLFISLGLQSHWLPT